MTEDKDRAGKVDDDEEELEAEETDGRTEEAAETFGPRALVGAGRAAEETGREAGVARGRDADKAERDVDRAGGWGVDEDDEDDEELEEAVDVEVNEEEDDEAPIVICSPIRLCEAHTSRISIRTHECNQPSSYTRALRRMHRPAYDRVRATRDRYTRS